jgi:spore maturation protein SpmA
VNIVFFALVALSFVFAMMLGKPAEVGTAALEGAKKAAELCLSLVGATALFLGLMKILEEAGGLRFIAWLIRPVLVRLFPDVPPDHPAMGAIVMNLAANALGLGNAATPLGLKAMKELDSLSRDKGVATDAMVLFLVINTSGLAILPTGQIALRQQLGSTDPAAIFAPALLATAFNTIIAVGACLIYARLPLFRKSEAQLAADAETRAARPPMGSLLELLPLLLFSLALAAVVWAVRVFGEAASAWILPVLIVGFVTIGFVRKVKVYEVFIQGAREGFQIMTMVIPYLVAILASVGMLRASGGLEWLTERLGVISAPLGLPPELLPLVLIKPLSGSGASGITTELLKTHGPDSHIGQLASIISGASDTTFYILAVYFGSVGVTRFRHAVMAGVTADIAAVIGSVLAVRFLMTAVSA